EGSFYLRQKFQYFMLRDDPSPAVGDTNEFVATSTLTYGLRRDMTLSLDVPLIYAHKSTPSGSTQQFGVDDLSLTFKYRPIQVDLNPIDSVRVAFFGGIEIPSGDADFSSESWDPYLGCVFTTILGRHGLSQSLSYKFNTGVNEFSPRAGDGPDDALRYDTSYLFRIDPAQYAPDTNAATYLTFELNGLYETSGDNEIIVGPGILYEARNFAFEANICFPVVQEVTRRSKTDLVVTFGFRVLF
ncbi:MAG: hypothetical protein ACOYN0_18435, partial [Phycisphaerales bacterium]